MHDVPAFTFILAFSYKLTYLHHVFPIPRIRSWLSISLLHECHITNKPRSPRPTSRIYKTSTPPSIHIREFYRRVAPRNDKETTTKPIIMGVLSVGWSGGPAFFFPVDEGEAVWVGVPEPGVAVPEDMPPETSVPSWDPVPLRP